jgi:hypothetical protein
MSNIREIERDEAPEELQTKPDSSNSTLKGKKGLKHNKSMGN